MHKNRRLARLTYSAGVVCLALTFALSMTGGVSQAAGLAVATAPDLGLAAGFSILGKAGVTNTGASVVSGNIGADNPLAITGFGSATVGGSFVSDGGVIPVEAAVATADGGLTSQAGAATPKGPNLTGLTLGPGVYSVGAALLPGTLILNGPGVYVFLATHITASGSVSLINGATPCNVFWHDDSDANINGGAFVGTIIAGTAVTFGPGASLNGRAFGQTANVTLSDNHIFGPDCGGGGGGGAPQPSYVDVSYPCSTDPATVVVTVGMSAGVIVYGLGDPITSATDTGANKIVRVLPFGHYAWNAVPPAGHYLVAVPNGVVDAFLCPGASVAATAVAVATTVPVLIPATGVDLAEARALAARQLLHVSLGFFGLGLVLLGIVLRRKRE